MDEARRNIDDLAREAGVSTRVVRDYIVRGLIPGADGRGRAAGYSSEHLDRLRAIQALRQRGRSLADIQAVVADADADEIRMLANAATPPESSSPSLSALEYLNSIGSNRGRPPEGGPPLGAAQRAAPDSGSVASPLTRLATQLARLVGEPSKAPPTRSSEWVRVRVTPDLELSGRGPLTLSDRLALERVADTLRDIIANIREGEEHGSE